MAPCRPWSRSDQAVHPMTSPDRPDIGREIQKLEAEPLLPSEKKLIAWSLGLGVVLLGLLVWLSHTFFPAPGGV